MNFTRLRAFVLALVAVCSLAATPVTAWSAPASQKGKSSAGGQTVHVKEYKKKDGTAVKAHERTATKPKGSSGSPTHAASSSPRAAPG